MVEYTPATPTDSGTVNGRDRHASELLRQNFFRACASWPPAFLNHGYEAEEVDEWIAKAQDEIVHMKARTYVGVRGGPAPASMTLLTSTLCLVASELGFEARSRIGSVYFATSKGDRPVTQRFLDDARWVVCPNLLITTAI